MTNEEIRSWMYKPENIGNCKDCPCNVGNRPTDQWNVLPCKQYNCWVDVTVNPEKYGNN